MPNIDKLDELLRRHAVAAGNIKTPDTETTSEPTPMEKVDPPTFEPHIPAPYPIEPNISTEVETDEIDYGDDDLENELKAEDDARLKERETMYANAKKNTLPDAFQAPDEKDENYNREAIGFQSEKLAIVAQMVNRVVAKYHIISGSIPDVRELPGGGNVQKMHIMGDLIDIYHNSGEIITPEFEDKILSNWILPNGKTAKEELAENGSIGTSSQTPQTPPETVPADISAPLQINVDVQPNTPVTINVDDSITANIDKVREIDVVVKEVTNLDMEKVVIVNNSDEPGVITQYDPGINDQPVTLPRSAYRCTISGINWFDFIKLTSAPSSGNLADNELRKWSIIYKHLKNASIGSFKDFTDFLQKTKYADRELLMWALLVATADPEEDIVITCGNEDCGKDNTFKYSPAKIIHFDESLLPKWYKSVHAASVGAEALQLWNEKSNTRKLYTLPTTGITVELEDPSVYDYIYTKFPIINNLYQRYRPGETFGSGRVDGDDMVEFQLLLSMALSISAIIIHKNGKDYRYDKWERIEEIITSSLDNTDSGVLIRLTQVVAEKNECFSFYLEDIVCPHCGRVSKRIPIRDISETLLSQLSQRLNNIDINLTDME